MPRPRLLMRQIRQVLRLKHEMGLSQRAIAQACCMGVGTVCEYLRRARQEGLSWPLPAEMDEATLEAKLFPPPAPSGTPRPVPQFSWIHQELKRPGVTLQLLWHEYLEVHPEGYRYTQFCDRYRQWRGKLRVSMRQVHRAGEKVFIDYSGKKPHIVERVSGELIQVELFVGVLGASSYTYAETTATQELDNWIGSHIRMLQYMGGSAEIWIDPGQPAQRRYRGVPLRADGQPHVRGDGRALRRGRDPGAIVSSQGQGEGRVRRAAGTALDPGSATR